MRKLFITGALSLFVLFALGGAAYACNDGAKATTAKSGCGSYKAASVDKGSCNGMKAASVDKGSCNGMKTAEMRAACAPGCGSKAQAVSDDLFLNSYANVKHGLEKGCSYSTANAVSAFKADVVKLLDSGMAEEHREHLQKLVTLLEQWPGDLDAQRASFQDLSNWTIGYVETFPERCTGVEIKTCKETGRSWVSMGEESANPYAG